MTTTPAILLNYLNAVGDVGCCLSPDPAATALLPVFVSQIYAPYRGCVFGRDYVLLICAAKSQPTPGQVEKHAEIARSALGMDVVFVFTTLPPFDRKRFIQRQIPFIVPGRQTYLPMVMMDLRERSRAHPTVDGQRHEILSAPAQVLVLFHLQKKPDSDDWPLHRWADVLGYSRMTLSRAYRELLSADLCKPSVQGRQVLVQFPPQRHMLWKNALPCLGTPVAGKSQVRIANHDDIPLYQAGMSSLAHVTMVAAGDESVFAMSSSAYRAALQNRKLAQVPYAQEDTSVIERWRYDPGLLSSDGHTVDRLSLYLSLQQDPNERVQNALKELLETISW